MRKSNFSSKRKRGQSICNIKKSLQNKIKIKILSFFE
jgi:hypothetical protein